MFLAISLLQYSVWSLLVNLMILKLYNGRKKWVTDFFSAQLAFFNFVKHLAHRESRVKGICVLKGNSTANGFKFFKESGLADVIQKYIFFVKVVNFFKLAHHSYMSTKTDHFLTHSSWQLLHSGVHLSNQNKRASYDSLKGQKMHRPWNINLNESMMIKNGINDQ